MANKAKIVPEAQQALDLLKCEIAAEMGLPVGQSTWANANTEFATELGERSNSARNEDYWGHISARDAGAVGGAITSRLIRKAEETLFTL